MHILVSAMAIGQNEFENISIVDIGENPILCIRDKFVKKTFTAMLTYSTSLNIYNMIVNIAIIISLRNPVFVGLFFVTQRQ